ALPDGWDCAFFFQAEDGIRDFHVTGVQTCALPISTGAGCGPEMAGLDFVRAGGRPLSMGGGLDLLVARAQSIAGRQTRRGGRCREFRVGLPYETGLHRHLAALAGPSCVVGTASPLLRDRLDRIATVTSACLRIVDLPSRSPRADGRFEGRIGRAHV